MASSSTIKCFSADCSEAGKLLCASCGVAKYCSAACQKDHWKKQHKAECKKQGGPTTTKATAATTAAPASQQHHPLLPPGVKVAKVIPIPANAAGRGTSSSSGGAKQTLSDRWNQIGRRVEELKMESQAAMSSQDYTLACSLVDQILSLAEQLPDPFSSTEIIHALIIATNAYTQLKNMTVAEEKINAAVAKAEFFWANFQDVDEREQERIQSLLLAATGTKSYLLLQMEDASRLNEAEACAMKTLEIAERIYPSGSLQLVNPLRGMAIVRDRQNRLPECATYFERAFVLHQDVPTRANQVLDELINVLMRMQNIPKAEAMARRNYDDLLHAGIALDDLVLSDAVSRIAAVVARIVGREEETDALLKQALTIREKKMDPLSQGLALTRLQCAVTREAHGKLDDETEDMLIKALDAFVKTKSDDLARQANAVLARIKHKRLLQANGGGGGGGGGGDNNTNRVSQKRSEMAIPTSFEENDGHGRMQAASLLFERDQYTEATALFEEAHAIFARTLGEQHEFTQAAAQNSQVARNKGIQLLCANVLSELVGVKPKATGGSASGSVEANSSGGAAVDGKATREKKEEGESGSNNTNDNDDDDEDWGKAFDLPLKGGAGAGGGANKRPDDCVIC